MQKARKKAAVDEEPAHLLLDFCYEAQNTRVAMRSGMDFLRRQPSEGTAYADCIPVSSLSSDTLEGLPCTRVLYKKETGSLGYMRNATQGGIMSGFMQRRSELSKNELIVCYVPEALIVEVEGMMEYATDVVTMKCPEGTKVTTEGIPWPKQALEAMLGGKPGTIVLCVYWHDELTRGPFPLNIDRQYDRLPIPSHINDDVLGCSVSFVKYSVSANILQVQCEAIDSRLIQELRAEGIQPPQLADEVIRRMERMLLMAGKIQLSEQKSASMVQMAQQCRGIPDAGLQIAVCKLLKHIGSSNRPGRTQQGQRAKQFKHSRAAKDPAGPQPVLLPLEAAVAPARVCSSDTNAEGSSKQAEIKSGTGFGPGHVSQDPAAADLAAADLAADDLAADDAAVDHAAVNDLAVDDMAINGGAGPSGLLSAAAAQAALPTAADKALPAAAAHVHRPVAPGVPKLVKGPVMPAAAKPAAPGAAWRPASKPPQSHQAMTRPGLGLLDTPIRLAAPAAAAAAAKAGSGAPVDRRLQQHEPAAEVMAARHSAAARAAVPAAAGVGVHNRRAAGALQKVGSQQQAQRAAHKAPTGQQLRRPKQEPATLLPRKVPTPPGPPAGHKPPLQVKRRIPNEAAGPPRRQAGIPAAIQRAAAAQRGSDAGNAAQLLAAGSGGHGKGMTAAAAPARTPAAGRQLQARLGNAQHGLMAAPPPPLLARHKAAELLAPADANERKEAAAMHPVVVEARAAAARLPAALAPAAKVAVAKGPVAKAAVAKAAIAKKAHCRSVLAAPGPVVKSPLAQPTAVAAAAAPGVRAKSAVINPAVPFNFKGPPSPAGPDGWTEQGNGRQRQEQQRALQDVVDAAEGNAGERVTADAVACVKRSPAKARNTQHFPCDELHVPALRYDAAAAAVMQPCDAITAAQSGPRDWPGATPLQVAAAAGNNSDEVVFQQAAAAGVVGRFEAPPAPYGLAALIIPASPVHVSQDSPSKQGSPAAGQPVMPESSIAAAATPRHSAAAATAAAQLEQHKGRHMITDAVDGSAAAAVEEALQIGKPNVAAAAAVGKTGTAATKQQPVMEAAEGMQSAAAPVRRQGDSIIKAVYQQPPAADNIAAVDAAGPVAALVVANKRAEDNDDLFSHLHPRLRWKQLNRGL